MSYINAGGTVLGCSFIGLPAGGGGGSPAVTFDPAKNAATNTLSNGNLTATANSNGAEGQTFSTTGHSTGKFYIEFTIVGADASGFTMGVGFANASESLTSYIGDTVNSVGAYPGATIAFNNSFPTANGPAFTTGIVVGMAVDFGAQLIWFNATGGIWNNNALANPATAVGGFSFAGAGAGPYFAAAYLSSTFIPDAVTANFGATAFANTAPVGFGKW